MFCFCFRNTDILGNGNEPNPDMEKTCISVSTLYAWRQLLQSDWQFLLLSFHSDDGNNNICKSDDYSVYKY